VKLVTVGDVMVDVVTGELPSRGERAHAPVALRAGGSSVNAALVARELGADVQLVGRVGSDPAADLVVAALQRAGVDMCVARDDERPTGTAIALGDAVVADRGANARLSPDDLPTPLAGDAMLVSGFALFQEGSRDAARAALERFEGEWTAVDLASPRLARGDFDARECVVDSVVLGDVRVSPATVVFLPRPHRDPTRALGNLGNGFLQHSVLTLDYPRRELSVAAATRAS